MKKIIIIFTIIIGLIIINIFDIYAYYNNFLGEKFYTEKKYQNAISNFGKNNSKVSEYNIANSLYKQEKYRDALQKYKNLSTEGFRPLQFQILHNIGNTIYKIGEDETDSKLKINYFTKSVENYSKALEIKFDEETKANLEFVQNKIKQEKEKQKKQEEKKDSPKIPFNKGNENKESGEKKKDKSEDGEKSDNQQGGFSTLQDKENNKKEERHISENTEKQLEEYQKQLKQQQKNNSGDFNKVYEEKQNNTFDNFDSFFSNDPFFDNSLLNNKEEKKDW